jgi:catechol 2,3-dioxygenase-like lactoylglutathione lyase family enzyme
VTVVLSEAKLVAFAATRDLEASHEFYGSVLGLELVETNPFANLYAVGDAKLRVTLVEELAGAEYTVLGWAVDDLEASILKLTKLGVLFQMYDGMGQDAHGIWTAPSGTRIAWFSDPDGNNISLEQAPAR